MNQGIVDKKVDAANLVVEEDGRDILLGGSRAHGVKGTEDAGESRFVAGVHHQMVPGERKVAQDAVRSTLIVFFSI